MLRTNAVSLIEMAVAAEIWPVALPRTNYRASAEGQPMLSYGTAGIILNARVGCRAYGWASDHIEPGVSVRHRDDGTEHALHYLTCVGNDAVVTTGMARGARGTVTGEHAHLLVDFLPDAMEEMAIGDKITVRTHGVGLALLDYPHITLRKVSPKLLAAMPIEEIGGGVLRVPVTAIMPAHLMGSGAELMPEYVDQDLMSNDRAAIAAHGLDALRVGDIVAITDHDHSTGRGYREGSVVIGLINHGDSYLMGHGPGVMTLLSCPTPHLVPVRDPNANIANYLGIGEWAATPDWPEEATP